MCSFKDWISACATHELAHMLVNGRMPDAASANREDAKGSFDAQAEVLAALGAVKTAMVRLAASLSAGVAARIGARFRVRDSALRSTVSLSSACNSPSRHTWREGASVAA